MTSKSISPFWKLNDANTDDTCILQVESLQSKASKTRYMMLCRTQKNFEHIQQWTDPFFLNLIISPYIAVYIPPNIPRFCTPAIRQESADTRKPQKKHRPMPAGALHGENMQKLRFL